MRSLLPTDTIATLATESRREAEEARLAKIRASKTNMEYLQNAGVIVTCDDEMDAAYRWERIQEIVKATGKTADVVDEEMKQEDAERNIRSTLIMAVDMNETMGEWIARRNGAMDAAQGTMESGRKCKHNNTQKARGWINKVGFYNMMALDNDGNWSYKCCRCGAETKISPATTPTEQATLAKAILAK